MLAPNTTLAACSSTLPAQAPSFFMRDRYLGKGSSSSMKSEYSSLLKAKGLTSPWRAGRAPHQKPGVSGGSTGKPSNKRTPGLPHAP